MDSYSLTTLEFLSVVKYYHNAFLHVMQIAPFVLLHIFPAANRVKLLNKCLCFYVQ